MQGGTPWNWILKFSESKNEISQRIQLKNEKNGVNSLFLKLTPTVMVIKMS